MSFTGITIPPSSLAAPSVAPTSTPVTPASAQDGVISAITGVKIGAPAPAPTAAVSTTPGAISVGGLARPQAPVVPKQSAPVPPIQVPIPAASITPVAPQTDFAKQLQDLETEALGKSVDKTNSENSATAPIQSQIDELNSQITTSTANLLNTENDIAHGGGDTSFQGGLATNAKAAQAATALLLTARVSALKGDLTTAKQQADDAIEAKYAQVTQDTQTARQNIMDNFDSMTPEQQKSAQDTLLEIDKGDSFVADQKANEKAIQDVVIKAAGNGASTDLLHRISSAKTPADATKIANDSSVLNAPATAIHDINGRSVLVNTKTGDILKDLGASTSSSSVPGKFSSADEQKLIGAGIPGPILPALQANISQYGLEPALAATDMSDDQKNAVRSAYGQ